VLASIVLGLAVVALPAALVVGLLVVLGAVVASLADGVPGAGLVRPQV
jgi:hypothetical protein